MTKPLKSLHEFDLSRIMGNDAPAALVRPASTPTPLAFPALARPRATPPGAPAPQSLSPCVRPHTAVSGPTSGHGARKGVRANGVGGAASAFPGLGSRGDLTGRVRT